MFAFPIFSLWPHMPRGNLRQAVPYVKALCKKWGIRYTFKPAITAYADVFRSANPTWRHTPTAYADVFLSAILRDVTRLHNTCIFDASEDDIFCRSFWIVYNAHVKMQYRHECIHAHVCTCNFITTCTLHKIYRKLRDNPRASRPYDLWYQMMYKTK